MGPRERERRGVRAVKAEGRERTREVEKIGGGREERKRREGG